MINITATPSANYSFNQWASTGGGTFANAASASTTFTMPANAAAITASFTYNGGSGGGNGSGNSGGNSITVVTNNATGTTSALVGVGVITALTEQAQANEKSGKNAVIEIKVDTPNNVKNVEAELPRTAFNQAANSTQAELKVNTGLGSITFSAKAVDAISGSAAAGDIKLSITRLDKATLSREIQNRVGNRPVYDFP